MKLLIILLLVFIIFLILSSISNKPLISQTKSDNKSIIKYNKTFKDL